jgi:hypothetical protein
VDQRLGASRGLSFVCLGAWLLAGCAPSGGASGGTAGTSGSAGSGGGAPAGAGGGGATSGAGGGGGAGAGGSATSGGAGGGATSGAGGGGAGGAGGSAGATGGAGGATGTAGAGGAVGTGDDYVSNVSVTVHPKTNTILVVTWTQLKAADTTALEFSFAGSAVMRSRAAAGTTGAHRDVVLGVPGSTAVTLRIVNRVGGTDYKTKDYQGTTGAIPAGMPKPTIVSYDATTASTDRYMFGAVEDSAGGCTDGTCYYHYTFWLYIMDRQGRMVWYYADPTSNTISAFPRVARDGAYIVFEKRPASGSGPATVIKQTLDGQYMETIQTPSLSDCFDITTDGSILYDTSADLKEITRAGTTRTIWSCRTAFGASYNCYSNTVNWNPADDTILMSFPDPNTVIQIDRKTGAIVATYGDKAGSYAFSPSTWQFGFQHYPNITAAGTLLVSSHMPGFRAHETPAGPNQHAFMEFTIDRTNKQLVEKWIYVGQEWPRAKGMAIRLANGNTLANFGEGGVIRELTPDMKTAFQVKFDVATGSDFFNKMVCNNVFVDDLYALNGGGPS